MYHLDMPIGSVCRDHRSRHTRLSDFNVLGWLCVRRVVRR